MKNHYTNFSRDFFSGDPSRDSFKTYSEDSFLPSNNSFGDSAKIFFRNSSWNSSITQITLRTSPDITVQKSLHRFLQHLFMGCSRDFYRNFSKDSFKKYSRDFNRKISTGMSLGIPRAKSLQLFFKGFLQGILQKFLQGFLQSVFQVFLQECLQHIDQVILQRSL